MFIALFLVFHRKIDYVQSCVTKIFFGIVVRFSIYLLIFNRIFL